MVSMVIALAGVKVPLKSGTRTMLPVEASEISTLPEASTATADGLESHWEQ